MHRELNLAVIGAGSAGLIASLIAATTRAEVALIERDAMGGDCLNTGCVPSKTLIASAKLAHQINNAEAYGLRDASARVDFAAVMERVRQAIAAIAPKDSVARYEGLGVRCVLGDARLIGPHEIAVGEETIRARRIVIASGARPFVPPIPGIDQVDILTSENLWGLDALPDRLAVLGAGPIGCELAQAFARLGSQVTLIDMAPRIMPREDADAARVIDQTLRTEGIEICTDARVTGIRPGELALDSRSVPFDRLLVAVGRRPRTENMGLEDVGVDRAEDGTIAVNRYLRTSAPTIYAAGDVVGPYQFTHMASHQAWYAAVNALAAPFWRFAVNYHVVPWATYTDPEVARVGLSAEEAEQTGTRHEVTMYPLDDLDRGIAEGRTEGFVKIVSRGDRVLGATIVAPHAGELIGEFVSAMSHGIGLKRLLATIHVYPTYLEANKLAAGAWRRANAPESLLRLAGRLHGLLRHLP